MRGEAEAEEWDVVVRTTVKELRTATSPSALLRSADKWGAVLERLAGSAREWSRARECSLAAVDKLAQLIFFHGARKLGDEQGPLNLCSLDLDVASIQKPTIGLGDGCISMLWLRVLHKSISTRRFGVSKKFNLENATEFAKEVL